MVFIYFILSKYFLTQNAQFHNVKCKYYFLLHEGNANTITTTNVGAPPQRPAPPGSIGMSPINV